ncbi:L-histidine N(alpha)-methyltransferase [Streptomyces sp. 4N509B]|uniref:L-histidine N(alpha)-methyltransferase n=1 Tax=Streptomyces sp. 4N509B TaxID=3457413 RepID=UPI003FD30BE2
MTATALSTPSRFTLEDRLPPGHLRARLAADVRAGMAARPRTLPPKWFYDRRGSELFEEITRLPEYYLTRAERRLLSAHAGAVARLTHARTLVEIGSGSSAKTRLLLDALLAVGSLERYAPLDVSAAALTEAGRALCRDYPRLRVTATLTDLETDPAPLTSADEGPGEGSDEGPRLVAFLGSTLGNLDAAQRAAFHTTLRAALTPRDALLVGVDLVKDPAQLLRAYDDAAGVTAAFNRNVLAVMNRELAADFDPLAFDHRAVWNAQRRRVEMRLRSARAQTVTFGRLDGLTARFGRGEELRTEISVKFRPTGLSRELAEAGWSVRHWWTDQSAAYALLLATPTVSTT